MTLCVQLVNTTETNLAMQWVVHTTVYILRIYKSTVYINLLYVYIFCSFIFFAGKSGSPLPNCYVNLLECRCFFHWELASPVMRMLIDPHLKYDERFFKNFC